MMGNGDEMLMCLFVMHCSKLKEEEKKKNKEEEVVEDCYIISIII